MTDERKDAAEAAVAAIECLIARVNAARDTEDLEGLLLVREQANVALAAVNRALGERLQ